MKKYTLLLLLSISGLPQLGVASAQAGNAVRPHKANSGKKTKALSRSAAKPLAIRDGKSQAQEISASHPKLKTIRNSPDQLAFKNADGISVATATAEVVRGTPMIEINATGNTRLTDLAGSAVEMTSVVAETMKLKSGKRVPLLVSIHLVSKELASAHRTALEQSSWSEYIDGVYDSGAFNKATFDLADALEQEFPALKAAGYDFVRSAKHALGRHYRVDRYSTDTGEYYPFAAYGVRGLILIEPAEVFTRYARTVSAFEKLANFFRKKAKPAAPSSILESYESE